MTLVERDGPDSPAGVAVGTTDLVRPGFEVLHRRRHWSLLKFAVDSPQDNILDKQIIVQSKPM
jgi:hypothetical protein